MQRLQTRAAKLDWEQATSDTRYLTHAIHRYSGKFIPQIAGQAIDLLSKPDELIVDPFVGSGTVPLEAGLRGRRSLGVDLNPLAVMISQVKTTPLSPEAIDGFVTRVADTLGALDEDGAAMLPGMGRNPSLALEELLESLSEHPRKTDPWFVKWFPAERLDELLKIDAVIRLERDDRLRSIGFVALSDVLRRSSRAHPSYPNVMYDRTRRDVPPVTPRFRRRLIEIAEAVAELDGKIDERVAPSIVRASACQLPLSDESVDAVITHPPYVGSVPYAEYGVLSLKWLGYDPRDIDGILAGGRRQSKDVVDRFERDLGLAVAECARVLRSGRHMFMLLGSPVVRGQRVDLPQLATSQALVRGFRLDAQLSRKGVNRRANLMSEEALLFFRKVG